MNSLRLVLAAVGAFVTYMAVGGIGWALFSRPMQEEWAKHSTVFRAKDKMGAFMPIGMLGMLLAMFALTVLFALFHRDGAHWAAGLHFGGLVALFSLGSSVLHNHMNLNVSTRLTVQQAIASCVQWVAVGVVIALIYRGPAS